MRHVNDIQRRIGGSLEEKYLGVRADRPAEVFRSGGIDEGDAGLNLADELQPFKRALMKGAMGL